MSDVLPIRRALVSVYDKTGVEALARGLHEHGVELLSTGSTARRIADAGVPVTRVSDVTGFPECLDGRVKTLHPAIHAGILADRSKPEHMAQLEELGIEPIDLVVVNLYPFQRTVAAGGSDDEVVEMIDIGGPTMVRAAAKNHAGVAVEVSPSGYDALLARIAEGGVPAEARRLLAAAAFAHTAEYDAAVSGWFHLEQTFPPVLSMQVAKQQDLRYGENPHQEAAFYVHRAAADAGHGLGAAEQLHGRALSYNNLVDTEAAWRMAVDLDEPCVAIIKHTNPAGYAVGDTLEDAYVRALAGDPVSAFGGIVAANRSVDAATAERIAEVFTEVVVAPGYDEDALEVLRSRKNLRLLRMPHARRPTAGWDLRSVAGGLLVQTSDVGEEPTDEWRVVTDAEPDAATLADLRFAWTVARHVKSNAIVLVRDRAVVGVGAGQMSRVDAVRLAVEKSDGRHEGAVLASDAFFPFRDGPDAAAAAGVVAIVQPGGSIRDDEVVAAADEHGVAMVLTGRRHFRH